MANKLEAPASFNSPVISRRQLGALAKVVKVVPEYQRPVLLAPVHRNKNLSGFKLSMVTQIDGTGITLFDVSVTRGL